MWSNIKTVVEEHISSENVYLHSAVDHWSWWTCTYHPTNKLVSTNQQANYSRTSFTRSTEAEWHSNEQKTRSKIQFSLVKRLEKENEFVQPIIVPVVGLCYKIV